MSEANIEIVRRVWDAAERRDTDAMFAFFDSAIVWDLRTVPGPLAGVYYGHDGVREWPKVKRRPKSAARREQQPE